MVKTPDFNRQELIENNLVEFFYDDTHPFSNVFPAIVEFNGVEYPTSEHAYQAQKFDPSEALDIIELIMNAQNPVDAKAIADANRHRARYDWNYISKFKAMKAIVYQKMIQNPVIAQMLINSRGKILVEDAPDDNCWGMVTRDGVVSGSNFIGRILMAVREMLINEA